LRILKIITLFHRISYRFLHQMQARTEIFHLDFFRKRIFEKNLLQIIKKKPRIPTTDWHLKRQVSYRFSSNKPALRHHHRQYHRHCSLLRHQNKCRHSHFPLQQQKEINK
jgi:hypothetical protein